MPRDSSSSIAVRCLAAALSCLVVVACSGTPVTTSPASPAEAHRVSLASIIDRSGAGNQHSLSTQVRRINAGGANGLNATPTGILEGVHALLAAALAESGTFTVSVDAELDAATTGQAFARAGRTGDPAGLPPRGAGLVVLGAITHFDAGASEEGLPRSIDLGDGQHGYVRLDLRIVDARTGRFLSSIAIDGRGTPAQPGVEAPLPAGLRAFQDTAMEQALRQVALGAVEHILRHIP